MSDISAEQCWDGAGNRNACPSPGVSRPDSPCRTQELKGLVAIATSAISADREALSAASNAVQLLRGSSSERPCARGRAARGRASAPGILDAL